MACKASVSVSLCTGIYAGVECVYNFKQGDRTEIEIYFKDTDHTDLNLLDYYLLELALSDDRGEILTTVETTIPESTVQVTSDFLDLDLVEESTGIHKITLLLKPTFTSYLLAGALYTEIRLTANYTDKTSTMGCLKIAQISRSEMNYNNI